MAVAVTRNGSLQTCVSRRVTAGGGERRGECMPCGAACQPSCWSTVCADRRSFYGVRRRCAVLSPRERAGGSVRVAKGAIKEESNRLRHLQAKTSGHSERPSATTSQVRAASLSGARYAVAQGGQTSAEPAQRPKPLTRADGHSFRKTSLIMVQCSVVHIRQSPPRTIETLARAESALPADSAPMLEGARHSSLPSSIRAARSPWIGEPQIARRAHAS